MTSRSAAERGPGPRDTPLDALVDALYEDRCLPPPQTDHALHVIAALRRQGFVISEATAAVPLDVERLARAYENSRQVDFWPDGRWAWVAAEYARLDALVALPAEGTE